MMMLEYAKLNVVVLGAGIEISRLAALHEMGFAGMVLLNISNHHGVLCLIVAVLLACVTQQAYD